VISSEILLSVPSTPLHKTDNTQDNARSNERRQRTQATPSDLRHFLLGYPPIMTLDSKRRDGGEEKVSVELAESIRTHPPEGSRVVGYTDL